MWVCVHFKSPFWCTFKNLMINKSKAMCVQTIINYNNRKNSTMKWFASSEHSGCASPWNVKREKFKLSERTSENTVNTPFIVNISLSVYHKLAFLVNDYIKVKGKYLDNFFQEACNNKASNYNTIRMLRSVFYRVINMAHG